MRTTTLGILLVGLTAHAQDDYYQRQLEQRQYDARLEAQRLESQRLQNQQWEAQRRQQELQQQDFRRRQERQEQEANDERWEAQLQRRRDGIDQQFAARKQAQDAQLQSALWAAKNRQLSRPQPTSTQPGVGCEALRMPQAQTPEDFFTGYFTPEKVNPYFMTAFTLGEDASQGRFVFEAHLRDGVLPTEVDQSRLKLYLNLNQGNGSTRRFRATSGAAEFASAVQSKKGRLQVELSDLVFVEWDYARNAPQKGGKCLYASRFTVGARWDHREDEP